MIFPDTVAGGSSPCAQAGFRWIHFPLSGAQSLLSRDEPLIAYEVEDSLRAAGAKSVATRHLEHALRLADSTDFSAVVLDFNLA
jgi:hypothetical protein